jgi:hypothetical protein
MARSTFSQLGLPLGENNTNMTYLYGVSDFFSVMFEDPEKTNLLMEASATVCSETYSRFLQLTSNVSLEDIQSTIGHTIKLLTIKTTDVVLGEVNVYKLSDSIISSRYIANRPLLPTTLFEENIDFRLEPQSDGSIYIRFAKDISSVGFPTRLLSDGSTKEYALWFVDCEIDEKLISKYYGNLIGLNEQNSTEVFKNFVYGLYYVYINGPVLDLVRKGLNLALGIPLCRGTETVLEIRKYLDTDQFIVVTDANQYIIPYGLPPVVEEGQVLQISDEIARWVEVKDYINDGDWWINMRIPPNIIPTLPPGQVDRYATSGSHYDYLMRTYLKKHTFLVNIRVTSFKEDQVFQELGKIIHNVKPAYTCPIYVWSVYDDETITLNEDAFLKRIDQFRCENITVPIEKFFRNNGAEPLIRGCPTFTRFNVPMFVTRLCGTDAYLNGLPDTSFNGISNGYVNPINQYRFNTEVERSWIRTILSRGSETVTGLRSRIGFYRSLHRTSDTIIKNTGEPVDTTARMGKVADGMKVIPLYTTTQADVEYKFSSLGLRAPRLAEWTFEFLNVTKLTEEINSLSINEGLINTQNLKLKDNFNLAFFRGTSIEYLSNVIPIPGYSTWAPPNSSYVNEGDYILGVRIDSNVVGMYWITSNFNFEAPYYAPLAESDTAILKLTNRPLRGLGPMGAPYYLLRGRGTTQFTGSGLDINGLPINAGSSTAGTTITNTYTDTLNLTPKNFTRDGTISFNHQMELN